MSLDLEETKIMIYIEQLERTKYDSDVKVMSAQSICNLIEK